MFDARATAMQYAQRGAIALVKGLDKAIENAASHLEPEQLSAAVRAIEFGAKKTQDIVNRTVGREHPALTKLTDAATQLATDYAKLTEMEQNGAKPLELMKQRILVARDLYSARNAAVGAFRAAGLNAGEQLQLPESLQRAPGEEPATRPTTRPVLPAPIRAGNSV